MPNHTAKFLNTLKKAKALFEKDALARFGEEAVEEARAAGHICTMQTDMGNVLCLTRRGRVNMGFKGTYRPTKQAATNSAFIENLIYRLQTALSINVITPRKYAISYAFNHRRVLGIARKDGFNRTTLRRIYEANIASGDYDEMHVFLYQADEDALRHLSHLLFSPNEQKTSVSRDAVRLYSIQQLAGGYPPAIA